MKASLEPLNFTPHDINVRLGKKSTTYQTVGVCRAKQRERCAFTWDLGTSTEIHVGGWAIAEHPHLVVMRKPEYDTIEWVPGPPGQDADVIVSVVAAPVVPTERPDLRVFVPDTGPTSAIRGEDGRIEAIRRLVLWHDPRAATHLLRVITLINPVNEGDGCYVHSRHLPTLQGIQEVIDENPTGGYLELVNDHGQSKLSGCRTFDGQSDASELWEWLSQQEPPSSDK